MIAPKSAMPSTILFLRGEGFHYLVPPDLNITMVEIPFDRRSGTFQGKSIDEFLLYYIDKIGYVDAVLVSPQPHVDTICGSPWLSKIAKMLPVGLVWYDYNIFYNIIDNTHDCLHIILDDQTFNNSHKMSIWTPFSLRKGPPEGLRDIDIGFFGRVDCEQRRDVLHFLLNKGIPVFVVGNDWSIIDDYNMMYSYMRRTKIILNFSNNRFHPDLHRQGLKGRVLEAMLSGAMVIENTNSHTTKYFKYGEDLARFDTLEELYFKIKLYLTNERDRIKIAQSGQWLCDKKYNTDNWWRKVIPRLLNFNKKSEIKM